MRNIDPDEFEALIIPGGDMVHLEDAEPLFAFVERMFEHKKLLAAIRSGPYVLARAGVLTDRRYTVTYAREQRSFLGCFDETTFRYEPVITDGHVITAQGHAFVAFGLTVARHLQGGLSDDTLAFHEGRGNALMEAPPEPA